LHPDEQYVADDTYLTPCALLPGDATSLEEHEYMAAARARHEQINRLFKLFRILKLPFERKVTKHGLFMHAVANIVQLGLMTGELKVFDVHELCPLPEGW
jgi:hypothetical protein